jgi:hypothetical protein
MAAILLLLCSILFVLVSVSCDEQFKINSPQSLLLARNNNSLIDHKPALFGIPSYKQLINGVLLIAANQTLDNVPDDGNYGCDPFVVSKEKNSAWYSYSNDKRINVILLISRGGGCAFTKKVKNAEDAGAASVIVYDDRNEVIPYMAADNSVASVAIPSLMINQADGQQLSSFIGNGWTDPVNYKPVFVTLSYSIPRPDGRVEADFWSISHDDETDLFKKTIGSAMRVLGDRVLFTPHYYLLAGENHGCTVLPGCGSQCVNKGKYCWPDPEMDFGAGFDGADVVIESARELVLWRELNRTNQLIRMYDFWERFYSRCNRDVDWDGDCSLQVVDSLRLAGGITGNYINSKIESAGKLTRYDDPADRMVSNQILDDELALQQNMGIFMLPAAFVNDIPYRGDMRCPAPISEAKCGILQQICAGFKEDQVPAACQTPAYCVFGDLSCSGNTENAGNSQSDNSGTSIGAVIGIVIAFAAVVGIAVYFYMRRQQRQVKQDIDSLLRQYLPLEENQPSPSGGFHGSGRGRTNPRLASSDTENNI